MPKDSFIKADSFFADYDRKTGPGQAHAPTTAPAAATATCTS